MLTKSTLREHVTRFMQDVREVPMQTEETLIACAIEATRFVSGYRELYAELGVAEEIGIDADLLLHESDWSLIHPLFLLYAERELARETEASQVVGMPTYVRPSSEILMEIATVEREFLPKQAFQRDFMMFE